MTRDEAIIRAVASGLDGAIHPEGGKSSAARVIDTLVSLGVLVLDEPPKVEPLRPPEEHIQQKERGPMAKTSTALKVVPSETKVTISPPRIATAKVKIVGTAPYIQNKFSSENREKMIETQKAGSQAKKTRKAKPPKDFERVYRGSMHVSREGWHGIPATALRNAMIEACRLTEMDMVRAKMAIKVVAQGLDIETLDPLVKIDGKPRMQLDRVRVGINSTDIVARAVFEEWSSTFEIQWDDDVFKAQDVVNLLARAGWQVGIGAGRPLSKMSGGTGKGTWEVDL